MTSTFAPLTLRIATLVFLMVGPVYALAASRDEAPKISGAGIVLIAGLQRGA